jgi:hypothetical protein
LTTSVGKGFLALSRAFGTLLSACSDLRGGLIKVETGFVLSGIGDRVGRAAPAQVGRGELRRTGTSD